MHEAEFVALSELFARSATESHASMAGRRPTHTDAVQPRRGADDADALSDARARSDDVPARDGDVTTGAACSCGTHAQRAAALREARVFRAQLRDAFDAAAQELLRELAADVLARELRLAPCDLAAIVRRVAHGAPVVCVRAAGADVRPIDGLAVVRDDSLAPGDAIVEVVGGSIDVRLGVRIADVLDAWR